MAPAPAVLAEGLVKRFGAVVAVDGLDLRVSEGTVLGLLGPNGAGKTTTVRILTTLLVPDAGRAMVAGLDVVRDARKVRSAIGLSGQSAAVDEYLTGQENLEMVGRLYHLGRRVARSRAGELLEQFDLVEAANRPVKTYSGGMRRRLDLAASLVARPAVIFLDEPTTGLDPRSRLAMWDTISGLVRQGSTVVLTTQYLEEADLLADEIVVIDHGRVIAAGTADILKSHVGGERLELTVSHPDELTIAAAELRDLGGEPVLDPHTRHLEVPITGGSGVLIEALRRLDAVGVGVTDVGVRRPTLDDVFLALTGQAPVTVEDEAPVAAAPGRGRRGR
ncbi:MAG: ATP-binding cassette domain-containing protein [Actinomycetes bacterium]